jgi:hypothetical protein
VVAKLGRRETVEVYSGEAALECGGSYSPPFVSRLTEDSRFAFPKRRYFVPRKNITCYALLVVVCPQGKTKQARTASRASGRWLFS